MPNVLERWHKNKMVAGKSISLATEASISFKWQINKTIYLSTVSTPLGPTYFCFVYQWILKSEPIVNESIFQLPNEQEDHTLLLNYGTFAYPVSLQFPLR